MVVSMDRGGKIIKEKLKKKFNYNLLTPQIPER